MLALEKLLDDEQNFSSSKERKSVQNKVKILKTIFDKETVSVGDLSHEIGLSFPTINALLVDLQEKGLLISKEKGESIGGRKPLLYQINDHVFNVLCVEVERFAIRFVVLDSENNERYAPRVYPFEISTDSSRASELIAAIDRYKEDLDVDFGDISLVGINIPGLVDSHMGTNHTFYLGRNFNLKDYLTKALKKYVVILNDVKAAAVSELAYGVGKNQENVLVILMDWGIGLGIIIGGQVYMGSNGFSGEMGHMVFEENGSLCYCGKRGCLETVASGVYLVNQAKLDISKGIPTLLRNLVDIDNLQPQHIIKVANEGDQYAIDLISSLGSNLGKAISFLIQVFNPTAVVLSGKFAQAGSLITTPIQQSLNTYTMNAIGRNCEVGLSKLGENGYAKGLVRFAFGSYLKEKLDMLYERK